jgi:hypothetical protein
MDSCVIKGCAGRGGAGYFAAIRGMAGGFFMADYDVGDRIIFKRSEDEKKMRGRVTRAPGRDQQYSVVTDSNRRVKVHHSHVKGVSPDRVLFLEGRLDRNLRSQRSYGPTFQRLLAAHGVEVLYEKIHTGRDLEKFLAREGRDPEFRVIHLSCHGKEKDGRGTAVLELTHESVDMVQSKKFFQGLKGKILIFSSCEIGNDIKAMQIIKEESQAAAVIAYTREVNDYYTNLAEHLLYYQLFENRLNPHRAVDVVREMLTLGRAKITKHIIRGPVITCY